MTETGAILAGRYQLVSLLGRGGMGEVWRAEHLGLRAPIAIKLMNPSIVSDPDALARFNREAQAAAALRSPHVVQVFDHGVDPQTGAPFIAMELMEGESLAHRLARLGPLPLAETARVVTHVARALARAHEIGIVHRDLKPDNIFLVRNEDEEVAKVLDFGIAKSSQALGPGSATRTGTVMGTPYYMSPEQITGAKGLDYRTDLWALGVIACECLTGKQPFEGETIGALVLAICTVEPPRPSSLAAVPAGFDAWFARATDRDIAARFQSARELSDALRQLTSGVAPLPVRPAPVGAGGRTLDMLPGTAGFTVQPVYHTHTDATAEPAPARKRGGAGLVVSGVLATLVVLGGASWFLFFSGTGGTGSATGDASAATSAPALAPEPSSLQASPNAPQPTPAVSATAAASAPAVTVAPVVNVAPAATAGSKSPAAKGAPATPHQASPRPAVSPPLSPPPAPPAKPPSDTGSVFDRRKG